MPRSKDKKLIHLAILYQNQKSCNTLPSSSFAPIVAREGAKQICFRPSAPLFSSLSLCFGFGEEGERKVGKKEGMEEMYEVLHVLGWFGLTLILLCSAWAEGLLAELAEGKS